MKKRGLSNVIVTLIIIVISLIAVGLVWGVARQIISEETEDISLAGLKINIKILKVEIDGNNISVNIKRNSGQGNLTGIKFIFSDEENTEIKERTVSLKELESNAFDFTLDDLNVSEVKSVSIAPIYLSNSRKETLGNVADLFNIKLSKVQVNLSWIEYENNPIIQYNDVIEGYIWNDVSVIKEENTYRMWLVGANPFNASPFKIKFFHATSNDGINWDINTNVILDSTEGEWDRGNIETPSVIKVGNIYHMYYGAYDTDFPAGIYSIGHATSNDGINWVKDPNNPLIEPHDNPLEWGFFTTAEPAIVYHNNKFYLYYASAKSNWPEPGAPFGIMVATSDDGSNFTDNKIAYTLTSSYNSTEYRGYSTPAVYVQDGIFYLYHDVVYSPDSPDGFEQIAISSAKSSDGFNFEEVETNIFTSYNGDWKDESVLAPSVLQDGNTIKIWFSGQTKKPGNPEFNFGIGYAEKIIEQ